MPSGNPILNRLAKVDRRLDDHERRLGDHDRRITATEADLRETNSDVAQLADIVFRSRRRAGEDLRRRLRRKR